MPRIFFPHLPSMMFRVGLCMFFVFGCGPVALAAGASEGEEIFPTDLEFVQDLVSDAFREIIAEMPLEKTALVSVTSVLSQKNDWIVRDALVKTLLEGDYALVHASPDSLPDAQGTAFHTLSFRLSALRLECETSGSWVFGHRKTMRRGMADFALRLTDSRDGAVIWAKQVTGQREDVVPANKSRSLEVPDALARQEIKNESHWLEGIVVAGIVASLVYLSL
ncbi:MAG: hypothetical protein V1800_12920 [Candidatus Latescibacterota bacterium]